MNKEIKLNKYLSIYISKYSILIIFSSIFWIICYHLLEIILPYEKNDNKDNNNSIYNFEIFFMSLVQLFSIFLFLIELFRSKKKYNISKNINTFQITKKVDNENQKISICKIIIYLLFFNFFNYFIYKIFSLKRSYESNYEDDFFFGFSCFLFSFLIEKFYYKNIMGKHKIITLIYFFIILTFKLITLNLNSFIEWIFPFIFLFLLDFIIIIKYYFYYYLMKIRNYSPFFLISIEGILSLIITYNSNHINIIYKIINDRNLIYFIIYLVCLYIFFIYYLLSIYLFSPISFGIIHIFIFIIQYCIYSKLSFHILLIIIILFFTLFYSEIIIFHFWNLDKYTKLSIEERAKKEIDEFNNTSIIDLSITQNENDNNNKSDDDI